MARPITHSLFANDPVTPVQTVNGDITELKEMFQQDSVLEEDCVSASFPKSRSPPEAVLEVILISAGSPI